ncbi:MAG TPA: phytanoyl-CoA dioxygenase family protein [Kiloniellales bacterium]|nr:phytanoyl-CoA dioxygenase family protein [Kiloniellales bacterium]
MTPEDILSHPPRKLTQRQREDYFQQGYLLVERFVDEAWLDRLKAGIARLVDRSRSVTRSDAVFDLEPGHRPEAPRLRRVSSPNDEDPVFWDFASKSPLGDLLADVLGPDVKFHQSKLNFKWAQGGTEVKWHQDAPFFPHTNPAVLTVGLYVHDCGMDQGPLGVIPGSHETEVFDHYADDGSWAGYIKERDLKRVALDKARYLCGPAGSLTLHNYRTVHGSEPNRSDLGRPLLLNVMSAADAFPYTYNPLKTRYYQQVIRGEPARWAHHDPRPMRIPPDWSGGYTSIFDYQQSKQAAAGGMM